MASSTITTPAFRSDIIKIFVLERDWQAFVEKQIIATIKASKYNNRIVKEESSFS
jgi:hypothetical protein